MNVISIFDFLILFIVSISASRDKEFCSSHFELRCEAPDEALMIDKAIFGVILGTCINKTNGVKCQKDLTDRISMQCLGLPSCRINNYHSVLKEYNDCGSMYNLILKVTYDCQKIERMPCASCSERNMAQVSSTSGYLASFVSQDSSCGSRQCPWQIDGKSGQKINLTLYDYSGVQDSKFKDQHHNKEKLFVIGDATNKDQVVVYREGGVERGTPIHSSLSSNLQLYVFKTKAAFLIRYEVWGCPDIEVSNDMSVQRATNHITVSCVSDGQSWRLVCMHNAWKGKLGTCEKAHMAGLFAGLSGSLSSFFTSLPFSILIATVVAIAVVLSVCILTIGFVCYRRSNQNFTYKASRQGSSMADQYVDINDPNSSLVQKIMATQKKKYMTAQRENKYAMNNRLPAGTRPLPSIPDLRGKEASVNAAMPPRMMIRSYGDASKRQSGGNKYYCIDNTLGHPGEMAREDLDMFPPPPELLQPPESSQGSAARSHAEFVRNNTYENQQAIMGTMATAGITAAAAASSEMLNKSMSCSERGPCISTPLNI